MLLSGRTPRRRRRKIQFNTILLMQVQIKDGHLVIAVPLQTPSASATGKTLVIASSRGNKTTDVELADPRYKGKKITVGVNAYISAK